MRKLFLSIILLLTAFLFSTTEIKATPFLKAKTFIKTQSLNSNETLCGIWIPFYTTCCGSQVLCGYVDITYDCNSMSLINIYQFDACGNSTICNLACGWG